MMFHVKVLFVFLLGFMMGVVLAVMLFFSYVPVRRGLGDGETVFDDNFYAIPLEEKERLEKGRQLKKRTRDSSINRNSEERNRTYPEGKSAVVICAIFSHDLSNSFAAADTWAKHCDGYHFYGNSNKDFYKYLNVTAVKSKHSWHFLCETIRHVHTVYAETIQWVLFMKDDAFAIPENLRRYVKYKDFRKPYYLGDISCFWFTYYNTAQAGYVLSKGAVELLVRKFNTTESCIASGKHLKNEDYFLGKHLYDLGVRPEDTRDRRGRGRFHAFTPEQLYGPDGDGSILTKYFTRRIHKNTQGVNCCNRKSITFQGSFQDRIFFYYYLLYRVMPFVLPDTHPNNLSNTYVETPQVWQQFVRDELGDGADLDSIDANRYYEMWARKVTPEELVSRLREESLADGSRAKNQPVKSSGRKRKRGDR